MEKRAAIKQKTRYAVHYRRPPRKDFTNLLTIGAAFVIVFLVLSLVWSLGVSYQVGYDAGYSYALTLKG